MPSKPSNPHHEEQDGCDHGRTGKDCRPDPSENGKDCLPHGNHGGINEDHCDLEVTTSSSTSTTTTRPSDTPTTTTTAVSSTTTSSTTTPESGTSTFTSPLPYTETFVSVPTSQPGPSPLTELPHTGMEGTLLSVGIFVTATGLILRRAFSS